MTNPLTMKSWSPYVAGAGIGISSWFAFANRPIGITTAFENTAALVEKAAVPKVAPNNDYFSKKEVEGKPPKIDWEWMLVIGVFIGAILSSSFSGDRGGAVALLYDRWHRRTTSVLPPSLTGLTSARR